MKWKKANIRFPVETLVTAEKLDYPVVIIEHEFWLEAENKRFNYIGVQYPVGFIPEGEYVFLDHDQVEGILNLGLLHEQHVVLSEMLDLEFKVGVYAESNDVKFDDVIEEQEGYLEL